MPHTPVLVDEVLESLQISRDDIVLDCTVGNGGHAQAICGRLSGEAVYIGIDADADAIVEAEKRLCDVKARVEMYEGNYRNLERVLDDLNIGKVDKVLFDLGIRMDQFESSGRGFSIRKDEPLVMTFKAHPDENDLTAYEIVNEWDESNIADIIYGYGEERHARAIARVIVSEREKRPIETTADLVGVIESVLPERNRRGKIHPATKTFQALRIAVNDEIESLRDGLARSFVRLSNGGRIAVISFHSIEDRVVKRFFKDKASQKECRLINKKPIVPDNMEISENPSSRSAKLRVIEKI